MIRSFFFRACLRVFALGVVLLSSQCLYAVNLIVNGDFEAGNTGFTSDYTYSNTPGFGAAYYTIGRNPNFWNGGWISCGDHTTGRGLMFIGNGATEPDKTVWQQTVAVARNTPHIFSFWGRNIWWNWPNPPQLRVTINGVQVGSDFTLYRGAGWQQFSVLWNSGSANQATIRLVDQTLRADGDDFALDDISLQAVVPEPGTMCLFSVGMMAMLIRWRKRA